MRDKIGCRTRRSAKVGGWDTDVSRPSIRRRRRLFRYEMEPRLAVVYRPLSQGMPVAVIAKTVRLDDSVLRDRGWRSRIQETALKGSFAVRTDSKTADKDSSWWTERFLAGVSVDERNYFAVSWSANNLSSALAHPFRHAAVISAGSCYQPPVRSTMTNIAI